MGRLGIRIANVALFSLCCFQVASVFNDVSADLLTPEPAEFASTAAPAATGPRGWDDRKVILERNLFGAQMFAAPLEEEPEPQEDLEETKLPLRLLGTQLSSIRENSKAAIAEKSGRGHQVLFEGDVLEKHPQATLVRIERRRVILQNGKRREELLLANASNLPAATTRPDRSARRRSRRSSRSTESRTSITDRLRELQLEKGGGRDARSLFNQAKMIPKWEDGQMVGMELREIEEGSLYDKAGLEEGDIIRSFNGVRLDSAAAGAKILSQFVEAEEWNIETDGGTITIGADELEKMLGPEASP
jgi:general secretion pathway protein C